MVGLGYWALVYAVLGQNITKTILLFTFERHNMKPQIHWDSVKELLFFGGGFTIARLSNQFALQADNLVVGRWLGSYSLGLYGRAYQLMIMPANLFGQVMDKVLFPAMARIQKEQNQLSLAYRIGITAVSFVTIPVGIFICLLSRDIVIILFGKDWLSLVPALQVLAVGLVFRTSYKISDSLVRATGAVYRRAWRQIIYALAVFSGAWIGQHWGIIGVSYGVLFAIIINYCLMTHLSMQFINLSVKDILQSHVPGLLLGMLAVISVWLIDWISIEVSILRIFLSGILFITIVSILIRINTGRILGKEMIWIMDQVVDMIKSRRLKK
ncbi:oligosaccharide flippase family protein [Sporosarcina thermotolerans]|nr:oligosaccharide flippase family protein [Sporosarcina thermotolerans]WHT48248.1 oligosaccharide flippase family protein [Sporosarcina thermotolerans]